MCWSFPNKIDDVVTTPDSGRRTSAWTARILLAAVLLGALVLGADLAVTHGKTARNAQIAEFDLGSLNPDQAKTEIAALQVAAASPVQLETESGKATVDPEALGMTFDADATLDKLMEQPKAPWKRMGALFGMHRKVLPVVHIDDAKFNEELDAQRQVLERAAVEGGVHYDGVKPVPDMPAAGLRIDRDAAKRTLVREWLYGHPITLGMESFNPTVSAETVDKTLNGPAKIVTSDPVKLKANGGTITVSPEQLGQMVTFVPDGHGGLRPDIAQRALRATIGPKLKESESTPVNASFTLSGGGPRVVPSLDGARLDGPKTATVIADTSIKPKARNADVAYKTRKPRLTTAKARKLGVKEVVSEFTTGDFSGPSGENIRLTAETVNGAVVLPGDTFSLNGYTGPRGEAQGYVSSTIIDHGHASKAVGGGISQFATTLYNAAYFAGLEDVAHTEHSYYISRYPEAREATVFEGAIDLQFRNNTDYGILIETAWSPGAITVRMWSTKTVEVESITGERSAYTNPSPITLPAGDDCMPSNGAPGFTTSNTRIVRSARTGAEISRSTRTVKYNPEPIVRCR